MSEASNSEPKKAGPRNAPLDLWRIAQNFLCELYMLFGGPDDVARRRMLTRDEHALTLSWLRAGEALLRRLLLLEAAAIDVLPAARPRRPRKRQRRLVSFLLDDPESWRVSFRATERNRRRVRSKAKTPAKPRTLDPRFFSAWSLAERYQALIRVFNEPAPYARRLARRLRVEPRCADRLLITPTGAENLIGLESFLRVDAACFNTRPTRPRNDSG